MSVTAWVVPAGVGVAAWMLSRLLARSRLSGWLADHPNARSLHEVPTPRVGGLAMMVVALPAAAWGAPGPVQGLVAVAGGLALLSARDDLKSLPVAVRLLAHLAAAAAAVAIVARSGIEPGPVVVEAFFAALAIAWMTNLYNFMDGADGLAGGMSVVGFGALGLAATQFAMPDVAWVCALLVAASLGFLGNNFPPARLFLGDAGSIPLGFLAGALGWTGVVRGAWPAWFPVLVFSPFIADATATLLRRIARREPFWRAHRDHAYQHLVLSGWSHRRLALWSYAVMTCAASSALLALRFGEGGRYAIIFTWAVIYPVLAWWIVRKAPAGGVGPEKK